MIIFSVVIPTYNRLGSLKRCLAGLLKQAYPHDQFEIIVISDGSKDETVKYATSIQTDIRLRVLDQPNSGPASARNQGIQHAIGKYVLFLDDDVVADDQLLIEHFRTHQEFDEMSVVIGPMLTPDNFRMSPWVAWEQHMLERQYKAMLRGDYKPTYRQFYTGNASALREHLNQINGFDKNLKRAEDVEMAFRLAKLGANFYFNPNAKVYHFAERSFQSWKQTGYFYGWNDVIFYKEKGMDSILPLIAEEFNTRRFIIKYFVKTFLDHKKLSDLVTRMLEGLGSLLYTLHLCKAAFATFSMIFNLQYYQGLSDNLGGKKYFPDLGNRVRFEENS